jgi:hypothetical protein
VKGCWHIVIYYVRVVCTFLAPLFLFVAGMAFVSKQGVAIGGLVITADPVWTLLAGMGLYAIAAQKAVRRF